MSNEDSSDDAAAREMIAWEIGDRWANKPGVPGDPRRTLHLFDAVREALAAGEARGRRLEREALREFMHGGCRDLIQVEHWLKKRGQP